MHFFLNNKLDRPKDKRFKRTQHESQLCCDEYHSMLANKQHINKKNYHNKRNRYNNYKKHTHIQKRFRV